MKVLILGHEFFSIDMCWGFRQAGCDASIVAASNAQQMAEVLSGTGADADLLITLGAPLELMQEAMTYLRDHRPAKLKHIHWDTDGISSTYFPSISGDGIEMDVIYAAKPDIVLTMCPEMRELISQKGFPCEIMYYAYCPTTHYPIENAVNLHGPISLIGNSYCMLYPAHADHYRYQSLQILLKPLLENDYAISLFGDRGYPPVISHLLGMKFPPQNYKGYLLYRQTCAVYNSSFINLATQNHDRTITKRTFEILGSGGFMLSSDNSEIRKLFTPGRDLVVSSSPEQTLELVRYYENSRDEWKAIRENAVRSVANHTYKQRAEYILTLVKALKV